MIITNLDEIRMQVAVPASPGLPDFIHELLSQSGALLDGHFSLQGGAHAGKFVRFRNIGRDRQLVDRVAERVRSSLDFEVSSMVVLAPESAGFFLGEAFARLHGLKLAVAQIDARRAPIQQLRFGELAPGARVLLVNDVATTGGSLQALRELVLAAGATLAGVAVFSTLDGKRFNARLAEWGVPGRFLVEARWPTYSPAECPLCSETKLVAFPATELN
jgi:orotate phosphoribosyltransferase